MDPAIALPRLKRYTELLITWNRGVSNLISRHDEARVLERHLGEAVEAAALLAASGAERWLDFGSGGGLPAIPLAIAGVGKRWVLVESRRSKTLFIRKAIQELGMSEIEVELGRLETVIEETRFQGTFDGFTSRATMALGPTLAMAAVSVRSGGAAFLWKGSKREEEMAADKAWAQSWEPADVLPVGPETTVVAKFVRR